MAYAKAPPPRKPKHKLVIGLMMFVVVAGGIVSFLVFDGGPEKEQEEIVIVDLALPPPPPPPPPPPEEEEPPVTEPDEPAEISDEIAEADTPDDAADASEEIDLGIDAGDLAPGTGGSFTVSVPRIGGRRGGGGGGGEGMLGSDMDSPPVPVSKIQPNYPSSLLSKGIGGKAQISCVVDETGKVVSTTIKKSAGHAELDKAAIAAVTKWKFKPAQKAGRNMRATCVVPFNFEVKKS